MTVELIRCDAALLREHIEEFMEVLRDCVDGGSSVNFIAPLDSAIARSFWTRIANDLDANKRLVFGAFEDGLVVGTVQLLLDMPPNQLHRVDLQKMLVHSTRRRQGIGAQLMLAAEDAARAAGRRLIVLDTERDSDAQRLYERMGYTRVGIIPNFALNHDGTRYVDTVYFYKEL